MLTSTIEYMHALQQKDYLQFLKWPAFVQSKYSSTISPLNSDLLIDCLVFEWLQCGRIQETFEDVAYLYALYELESSPLQLGRLGFALMSILSALFTSIALLFNGPNNNLFDKSNVTQTELSILMDIAHKQYGQEQLNKDIAAIRDTFMKQILLFDPDHLDNTCSELMKIIKPGLIVEEYIYLLTAEQNQRKDDKFLEVRLVTAQGLSVFLQSQSQFSESIPYEINRFITMIRRQQPASWENQYLNTLSPLTIAEKAWGLFTSYGVGFFSFLENNAEIDDKRPTLESII